MPSLGSQINPCNSLNFFNWLGCKDKKMWCIILLPIGPKEAYNLITAEYTSLKCLRFRPMLSVFGGWVILTGKTQDLRPSTDWRAGPGGKSTENLPGPLSVFLSDLPGVCFRWCLPVPQHPSCTCQYWSAVTMDSCLSLGGRKLQF